MRPILLIMLTAFQSFILRHNNNNNNNNNNNDLLTDPLGGSSLLNYINYNYKINQIKLFTNYAVEAGLTESNYSKTD